MTVRKGQPWGHPGSLPPGAPVAASDAAVVDAWLEHRSSGAEGLLVIGLRGGDLHRTLGSPPASRMTGSEAWTFPVDLMRIHLDDRELWGAAHLVAGGSRLFRGWSAVVMNAAFRGAANLGPRAHPGDGLLDVTVGSLGFVDRRRATARMGHGAHLPHPALEVRRSARWEVERRDPVQVSVDDRAVGTARRISVEVLDAAILVVV